MKHLILATELFRRANIRTMYRASVAIALVTKPGITTKQLSLLMQTSREAMLVSIVDFVKLGLAHTDKLHHANGRSKETKVYPTPYLKDVIGEINHELKK